MNSPGHYRCAQISDLNGTNFNKIKFRALFIRVAREIINLLRVFWMIKYCEIKTKRKCFFFFRIQNAKLRKRTGLNRCAFTRKTNNRLFRTLIYKGLYRIVRFNLTTNRLKRTIYKSQSSVIHWNTYSVNQDVS